jgi:hypothetical protein
VISGARSVSPGGLHGTPPRTAVSAF